MLLLKTIHFPLKSSNTFIPVKKFLGREINCLLAKKKEGKKKMDGGRKGGRKEEKIFFHNKLRKFTYLCLQVKNDDC